MGTNGPGGIKVPSKEEAAEEARRRAEQGAPGVGQDMIRRMQEGAARSGGTLQTPALEDRNLVLKLLSSKELTAELESRYPHIKEATGKDPKAMPAHEVVDFRRKLAAEAVNDASDIAKIAKEKGEPAAIKEIAGIGERLIIEALDKPSADPGSRRRRGAELQDQDPAAETTRVAAANQTVTSTLKI